jgi:UDP-N-acetyl-D-mannosaminuronic acid dehydrogenase
MLRVPAASPDHQQPQAHLQASVATSPVRVPGDFDLVVVGGCGHVGLPLALSLVQAGSRVGIFDTDEAKIERVRAGEMPFLERDSESLLSEVLPSGRLELSSSRDLLSRTDTVILVVGTPVDEFLSPSFSIFDKIVEDIHSYLRDGALIILRSTVYPGTTEQVQARLHRLGVQALVVYCPERIAEGHAVEEIRSLPQLIGATDDLAFQRASRIFTNLDVEVVRMMPAEAEVAKLMTNAWRYLKFAIANQFFRIAHEAGLNYDRILHGLRYDYPRAADLPGPGFAGGPCLMKDTMQLAAFTRDRFPIGHLAMLINEGLPDYVIDTLDARQPLSGRTVGILGMAFKGESDDPRNSLSYKLKKLAQFRGARVLCTDPYVRDPELRPLAEVLPEADIIIVAAPHRTYRRLNLKGRDVVDLWGVIGDGIRL